MTFIQTVPPYAAGGQVADLYAADVAERGYVANYTRAFSLRPGVLVAWRQLLAAVVATMDRRRFELATLAAASALRSTYCAMAHARVLRDGFHDADTVRRIVTDPATAGLDPTDLAVMEFAEQVARDATSIGPDDVDRLRTHGLSDAEILDVILAVAARCFFSTVLDAAGVRADVQLSDELEPALRAAVTVGRPPADRLPADG